MNFSALAMKDGRWSSSHVGVKAPGTPQITTFLPAKMSLAGTSCNKVVVFFWGGGSMIEICLLGGVWVGPAQNGSILAAGTGLGLWEFDS